MYDEIKLPNRNEINAKYLFVDNINYKLSRNNLIALYRKYRAKMSGLVDTLDLLLLNTDIPKKQLTPMQQRCASAISEEFAKSTKENRIIAYKSCVDIMSRFIYSFGTLANEPIAKNEIKILKMMASYMFFKASECIDELNMR